MPRIDGFLEAIGRRVTLHEVADDARVDAEQLNGNLILFNRVVERLVFKNKIKSFTP